MTSGYLSITGRLRNRAYRQPLPGLRGFLSPALPWFTHDREVNLWRLRMLPANCWQFAKVSTAVWVARRCGVYTMYGRLSHRVYRGDGRVQEFGIAGYRVITTAFANYVVDAMQADQAFENFKFHGWGTGSTAEAIGDTGLVTELTTEYAVDNTRVTGSQGEGAANVYRTLGTLVPNAGTSIVLREHGVFLAATGATTLLDRTMFAAITLVVADGDSLASTYDMTAATGG
jgi:hypothetical protein